MSMQVRRAPNASAVRLEHWFVVAVAVSLALAAAWLALAAAAEAGALIEHRSTVRFRDAGDVFMPLLRPADPGEALSPRSSAISAGPRLFWSLAVPLWVALMTPVAWLVVRVARWASPSDRFRGQATPAELARGAGRRTVLRQAVRLRPSLQGARTDVAQVAIRVGQSARDGAPVYMSFQNNLGLVAGPQTGKTTSTMGVVPLLFPGPAIMTETHRPDVLAMSACQPGFDRPVLVLDPENRVGWPETLGVDVLAGCEDHAIAIRRASLLIRAATVRGEGTSGNMEFFIGEATTAATAFLHAARIGEVGLDAVLRWTQRWGTEQPVEILQGERDSVEAQNDAEMLRQLYAVTGPQAAGTAGELRNAFGCLADPSVARAFSGTADSTLDIRSFLHERARLYVHGSGREQRSIAPFVALVITEIVEEALAMAATAPQRRLDPPLLLDLDEVANIAPLPELPYYLSAGTGSGVCTVWAAQGRAQLRRRWGPDAAREVWQSTNYRLWFGGSVEAEDLRELEDLSGEVFEESVSEQRPEWLEFMFSGRQSDRYGRHRSLQRIPVLSAHELRTLPDGHALLLARNLPAAELVMHPWWERRDIAQLVRESMHRFDEHVRRAADRRAPGGLPPATAG